MKTGSYIGKQTNQQTGFQRSNAKKKKKKQIPVD